MPNYDSDSSDGELDVQTNVLLGYVTPEPAGDEISHVGGHPTWLDESHKPSASFARCKICNGHMSLLLQLQASLKDTFPGDDRSLFIWCCRKKSCSKKHGSIRCFREVRKTKARTVTKPTLPPTQEPKPSVQVGLGTQLFGGPAPTNGATTNPFSTTSTSKSSATNPFSTTIAAASTESAMGPLSGLAAKSPQPPTQTLAEKLRISDDSKPAASTPVEPWPSEDEFPNPLPRFYLDAEAEYLEPTPTPSSVAEASSSRITELDEDAAGSSAAEKDLYESPHDKTFDHFTRILSQNSEQVLRYEHQGTPLLYSSSDTVATHFVLPGHIKTSGPVKGIPRCADCGSARVFECQLVPNLIYELEKDNEEAMKIDGQEGMEWGTVIVGTCSKNCGEPGTVVFREEWVGVQWEEGGVELKQKR